MQTSNYKRHALLIVLPLLTLLGACGSVSPAKVSSSVPPLPAQFRMPPIPSECVPSCLAGLMRDYNSSGKSPTKGEMPLPAASVPTTR